MKAEESGRVNSKATEFNHSSALKAKIKEEFENERRFNIGSNSF